MSRGGVAGPRDRAVILDAMARGQVVQDSGRTWRHNNRKGIPGRGLGTVSKVPISAATMAAFVRNGLAVLDSSGTWRRTEVQVCPKCGREVHPWPLARPAVCSPADWAHCIRPDVSTGVSS